jgi:opacity protein-like surface antigen
MKKVCCSLFCAVLFTTVSSAALAADISVDASTLLGIGQRDVSGSKKETLLPATQFMGLDVDKLADGNLSLHFHGWGRADLGDKSYNGESVDGNLTYGYLQYRFKEAGANVRAGRVFIHEGIVNEQIDGISARTDLPAGFGVSAFAGAVVHGKRLSGEASDGKGDTIAGGRASYSYKGMLELGLSGLFEANAPSLTRHSNDSHRLIGGDLWLNPHKMVAFMGHSSYNPETQTVTEHNYLLTVKPLQQLIVSAEFNEFRAGSYFSAAPLFSSMPSFKTADRSRTIGGSVSYQISKNIGVAADYKHYTRQFGNADRYGTDVRLSFSDNSIRGGLGYHYLRASQGFAITPYTSASYHELRGYLLHDTKGYFSSIDVLGYFFNEKIYNENSAWEGTVSLGYHLNPALALSGDISYGRNPEFADETKGLLRLTYNMTFEGKGGKK